MADAAEATKAPELEKGFLSSTFTTMAATNPLTAPAYWAYKGVSYATTSIKAAFVDSDSVIDKIGESKAFEGEAGQAALAEIKGDEAFTTALNAAIERDPSVARGLAGGATANGNTLNMDKLAESLKDGQTRETFTNILNKVAESPDDKFNFDYMVDIASSVEKGDYAQTKELLAEGGLSDPNVDMAAGGAMGMLSMFFGDPDKRKEAIGSWINNPEGPFKDLDPQYKNMLAGLVDGIANFLGIYRPGQGIVDPYIKLAGDMGDRAAERGSNITGIPNRPSAPAEDGGTVGSLGNITSDTKLAGLFNLGGLNQRPMEPDSEGPAQNVPGRVEHKIQGQAMSGAAMGLG